jgi:hypothetical protein
MRLFIDFTRLRRTCEDDAEQIELPCVQTRALQDADQVSVAVLTLLCFIR